MKRLLFACPLAAFAAAACASRPTPVSPTEPAGPPPSYGWTPPVAEPPAVAVQECVPSGCEGSQCVEAGTETEAPEPCEAPPQAKCLVQTQAKCEMHADGQCGWTKTPELVACLEEVGAADSPPESAPGLMKLEVIHNQMPGMAGQVASKPYIVLPAGEFPSPPIQLRVGTFVYNVQNGQIRGVPVVTNPTPATLVLQSGTEIPVELVRTVVH
jgi:hypothetical protein